MDMWEEEQDRANHPDLAIGQECDVCGYVKKALEESERDEVE